MGLLKVTAIFDKDGSTSVEPFAGLVAMTFGDPTAVSCETIEGGVSCGNILSQFVNKAAPKTPIKLMIAIII
jgi:hypothetical protein